MALLSPRRFRTEALHSGRMMWMRSTRPCGVGETDGGRCRKGAPAVIDGLRPRKPGSQWTLRWSKRDSNPRSLSDWECWKRRTKTVLTSGFIFTGDRGFESVSLHRRVLCELDFLASTAAPLVRPIISVRSQSPSRQRCLPPHRTPSPRRHFWVSWSSISITKADPKHMRWGCCSALSGIRGTAGRTLWTISRDISTMRWCRPVPGRPTCQIPMYSFWR
jgi:hypothetical protein